MINNLYLKLIVFPGFAFLAMHVTSLHAQEEQPNTAKQRVVFEARLSQNGRAIENGVEWRVYSSSTNPGGKLSELGYAFGGSKAFNIASGEYLVHAAYGHAGAVRKIIVTDTGSEGVTEIFSLNAGGLRLQAFAAQNTPISDRLLKFDIYEEELGETGQRKLLARDIKPGEVVAFPVDTYHVVSRFGDLNAEVRADLRVELEKLTEATLTHRAAIMTFRLVREKNGDAVADTAWSILTETGEVIQESTSTFPSMVLSEGNYTAIAKHDETIFSQEFQVRSGINTDVEVLAIN